MYFWREPFAYILLQGFSIGIVGQLYDFQTFSKKQRQTKPIKPQENMIELAMHAI